MKKLKIVLIFLIMMMSLTVVVGCASSGPTDDSSLRAAGNYRATFDAMGGHMGNYATRAQYALPNSPLVEPGSVSEFDEAVLGGHKLVGWFLGESDGMGKVIYGSQWNFQTSRMPSHDITLYAKWEVIPTFVMYYGKNNSEMKVYNINDKGTMFDNFALPAWEGHTLLSYFADEALTIPFDFSKPHNVTTGKRQVNIYTKWLVGNYKLVREAADFKNVQTAGIQFYLLNDIDFAGKSNLWSLPTSFTGKIIGNGYTIRNLSFETNQLQLEHGILGKLNNAEISNVTFENISYTLTISQERTFFVGLLAGEIRNSKLTNIDFVNCNVLIKTGLAAGKRATVYTSILTGSKLLNTTVTDCDFEDFSGRIEVTNDETSGLNEGGLIVVSLT